MQLLPSKQCWRVETILILPRKRPQDLMNSHVSLLQRVLCGMKQRESSDLQPLSSHSSPQSEVPVSRVLFLEMRFLRCREFLRAAVSLRRFSLRARNQALRSARRNGQLTWIINKISTTTHEEGPFLYTFIVLWSSSSSTGSERSVFLFPLGVSYFPWFVCQVPQEKRTSCVLLVLNQSQEHNLNTGHRPCTAKVQCSLHTHLCSPPLATVLTRHGAGFSTKAVSCPADSAMSVARVPEQGCGSRDSHSGATRRGYFLETEEWIRPSPSRFCSEAPWATSAPGDIRRSVFVS